MSGAPDGVSGGPDGASDVSCAWRRYAVCKDLACYVVFDVFDIRDLAPERIRPISRREYELMVAAGVFDEDERVELLEGVLVEMSPQDLRHAWATEVLTERLVLALAGRARLRCQLPLAVSDYSVPEPDFAVVPITVAPTEVPTTAHLVIEVANSSLHKDRVLKARVYAAAGVPDYWIVNVPDQVVEVHAGPTPEGYTEITARGSGETVSPRDFPDVAIGVDDLWPTG